ncbi:hypothetical protein JXA02_01515 [candidate division KSB1 bacterium]|nr:hypothetical protein [candidate division KSB1 bacterium]RQW10775.1 MAG: hypothetical protein EH222_01620 [candidate division KSB1 bacterium]
MTGAAAPAQERQSEPAATVVDAPPDSTKNPTGAMVRSILLPGWGQFYNGKWFKGIIIAGAEVGLIANAIVLNQWANEAATEEEFLFYIDNRNLSFWLLGATILYSMADAYVDAHLFQFDESPQLTLFFKPENLPGSRSSALMMRLSFSIK